MLGSRSIRLIVVAALAAAVAGCQAPPPMLALPGQGELAPADWAGLPRLASEGGVVFRGSAGAGFNIHNYLHHDGAGFRLMWTSSPVNEGEAGSRVMEALSEDGLTWAAPTALTPAPPAGQRLFARGYWDREGSLMALASQDRTGPYFGEDLQMLAFEPPRDGQGLWSLRGQLLDGAIVNYPPQRLGGGAWLESTRDSAMGVGFMKGGQEAWNAWRVIAAPKPARRLEWRLWPATPAERRPEGEAWKSWIRLPLPVMVRPQLDEPIWWALPDGRLSALYRDNSGGGRLYRAMGSADGETWTRPVRTNFPDAASKLAGLRLSNGLYVLVSNPRPGTAERNPLALSVSRDGLRFEAMAILRDAPTRRRLFGLRKTPGYQYPHLIEHGGWLYVAYSRNKEDIEILRAKVADIQALATNPADRR